MNVNLKYIIIFVLIVNNTYSQHLVKNISFIKKNNYIILTDVVIQGSTKKFNFLFDTGSSSSSISNNVFKQLNVTATDSCLVSDGMKKQYTPKTNINLTINDVLINNLTVNIIDFSCINSLKCLGIDGIIGGDIIGKYIWKIKTDTLIIGHKIKKLNTNYYSKFKLQLFSNTPVILAGFKDSYMATMLFDTGDNTLIAINNKEIQYIDIEKKITGYGKLYSTIFSNNIIDTMCILKPKKELSLYSHFYVSDINLDINYSDNILGTVGNKLLNYFDIILDYKHKKIYFKQKNKTYISNKEFEFKWIIDDENRVLISFIWKNSLAEKLGVKIGQQIISINGINLLDKSLTKCDIFLIMLDAFKKETQLKIKLKDNADLLIFYKKKLI